jgi:peptidoglycan-associated lipoprotein
MPLRLLLVLALLFTATACSDDAEEGALNVDSQTAMGSGDMYGGTGGAGGVDGSIVPGSQADLAQNVGDRVFFAYDSYDLSPEARATLDRQAQWLNQYGQLSITIEGHADERGTREYNLALGEKRANAVKNYLSTLGVDGGRLSVISYGKERPEVPGDEPGAWAQNRRSVTVVQ